MTSGKSLFKRATPPPSFLKNYMVSNLNSFETLQHYIGLWTYMDPPMFRNVDVMHNYRGGGVARMKSGFGRLEDGNGGGRGCA